MLVLDIKNSSSLIHKIRDIKIAENTANFYLD